MNKNDNRKVFNNSQEKNTKTLKKLNNVHEFKPSKLNNTLYRKSQGPISNKTYNYSQLNAQKEITHNIHNTSSPHWPIARVCLSIKDTPRYAKVRDIDKNNLSKIRKLSNSLVNKLRKTLRHLSLLLN